jgi:hypothetical protein
MTWEQLQLFTDEEVGIKHVEKTWKYREEELRKQIAKEVWEANQSGKTGGEGFFFRSLFFLQHSSVQFHDSVFW